MIARGSTLERIARDARRHHGLTLTGPASSWPEKLDTAGAVELAEQTRNALARGGGEEHVREPPMAHPRNAEGPKLKALRAAYRTAAERAERPDASAEDHATWLEAQQAYYAAGGRDPAGGWKNHKRKKSPHQKAAEKQAEREKCAKRIAELEHSIASRRRAIREAEDTLPGLEREKKKEKTRAGKAVFQDSIDNAKKLMKEMGKEIAKESREIAQCANKIARLAG